MNQQRGFTLLEMMLVLALVAITASVVLFTYGREDAANTRARETAARFTAALELAIDRATLSGQPVGIHFSDSAWRIMVPGKTPSAWRWVPLQEDAADESKNDWGETLSSDLFPLNEFCGCYCSFSHIISRHFFMWPLQMEAVYN